MRVAQSAVNDLKGELQKGVNKMFENQENLNSLGEKTTLMKSN